MVNNSIPATITGISVVIIRKIIIIWDNEFCRRKSMDSSDDNSDSELFSYAARGDGDLPDFPVPEQSQLKPKLDSIFAEVKKNLPSIDFDLSDVRTFPFFHILCSLLVHECKFVDAKFTIYD